MYRFIALLAAAPLPSFDIYAVYQYAGADVSEYAEPDQDHLGNTYHDIAFPGDMAKLILDAPPPEGYTAVLRVYAEVKRAVVVREDDLLTPEEMQQHGSLVQAGIREELLSWVKHECFTRKPRRLARNILDVRWVAKWKFVKAESADKGYAREDGTTEQNIALAAYEQLRAAKHHPNRTSARKTTDASRIVASGGKVQPKALPKAAPKREDGKVRVVRMRMTLRGFKDWDAELLETYSGTAQRISQRLLPSEAACRGWPMITIDVRKAFLKGITYEELAQQTGEPKRDVNFEVTADVAAVLRTIPGYENFDHRSEVLACTRPGTGSKDAPRCWSMRLSRTTKVE